MIKLSNQIPYKRIKPNGLKRHLEPEMTQKHQDYTTLNKGIDKIGNLVSVLLSDEKKFLEWQYSVKLLYKLALNDLL
jgi:hypothetical protein